MPSRTGAETQLSAKLLAKNLKAFNAKERDHLMRMVYLGQNGPYTHTEKWMSGEMEEALCQATGVSGRCTFAGMDYHLDWLYAALLLSCRGIDVQEALGKGRDPLEGLRPQWCDGREEPLPAAPVEQLLEEHQSDDPTLYPVSGLQEDLDLLAIFEDDHHQAHLLFVEAKGVASFGLRQLTRKLTRLNKILNASGARQCGARLHWQVVLVSPKKPPMEELGKLYDSELESCASRGPLAFVPLNGLPPGTPLAKVSRIPTDQHHHYTHWEITPRWKVAKR